MLWTAHYGKSRYVSEVFLEVLALCYTESGHRILDYLSLWMEDSAFEFFHRMNMSLPVEN